MPSDFNIPLSMPSWNEQVTARPQHGLLSQQAHYLQQQERIAAARAAALAEAKKPKYDGRMTLSKGPELRDIPQMYEDPNATNYGFLNNSQAEQYNPQLPPPPLSLGAPTGLMTTEGRRAYHNNFGGMSTEYSIGTKNPKINNGLLTHIPSIYDGQIVDQRTAEDMIIRNNGVDPETGRFITPGGDPEARSQGLSLTKQIARKPASLLTPSSNDGLLGRTPPPEMPDTQGRSIYEPPHGSVSPLPQENEGEINQQQQDEGWSATAYDDETNVDAETGRESRRTIGYGFNMDQEGAEQIARAAGITHSWADLRSGAASLTREEGRAIQNQMQPTFRRSARNFAGPATWRLMTNDQKNALINVASNMGPRTLRTFGRMQAALQEDPPNFVEAARQLVTTGNGPSLFARQVGDRATRVSTRLAGTP
jgi:hypothetical protein